MGATKPYLIRAIHEWCTDEGFTPYLAVNVDTNTHVPREFVRDGQIVLNVSADATHQLQMGNDEITFQTRFNGAAFPVVVPVEAVAAIYARENGQGMAFDAAPVAMDEVEGTEKVGSGETTDTFSEVVAEDPAPRRGGHLTRIK